MTRTNSANLDGLRPAEKAIFQRVRPYLGRSDLAGMVARIRRAHPVWSDVYNLTPERVLEVLERLGLESEILPPSGLSGGGAPAEDQATLRNDASNQRTPAPRGRRGKRQIATLPFDTSWLERTGRGAAVPGTMPTAEKDSPAAPAPGPPADTPYAAEPVSERAAAGQLEASPAPTPPIPTSSAPRRKKLVEQVSETRAANPPADESTPPSAERSAARKARPATKNRPAGSVDELLQQIDVVASEISGEEATIEQANRRIADLERRRQALCDQLALTLRSRVPVEILRLAADAGKPGETPTTERRRSSG